MRLWNYFGRAEININPWESLLRELKEGNNRRNWIDREPYAYWKGNPFVAETRRDLLTCNLSDKHDWNARLYVQVISFIYITHLCSKIPGFNFFLIFFKMLGMDRS